MSGHPLFVGPLLHLRTVPAFEELPQSQLTLLAYETEEIILQRGAPLIDDSPAAPAMYLLVDGYAQVEGPAGRSTVGPGGVVGFLEALAGPAATGGTRARAETDLVALRLETDALRTVGERSFGVLLALLRHVASQVVDLPQALVRSVEGRSELWPAGDKLRPDRVGRILALHRAPMFGSSHMDALAELAGHMRDVRLPPGTPLWTGQGIADGLYLVASGSVALRGPGWPTEPHVGAGSVPGLVCSLAGRPYAFEARSVDDVRLFGVGVEPLLDVLEDHFEMAFGFVGALAAHVLAASADAVQPPPAP